MKTILLALFLGSSLQPGAPADGWAQLLMTPDGSATYYEPASLSRGEGTVRARVRVLPAEGRGDVREFRALEEVHCARRTTRTVTLDAEMRSGEKINVPMNRGPVPIQPGTPIEALHAIVCAAPETT
jgi:hypothetical protein